HLADQRVGDLVQRLELAKPARRRLVQSRVLDRDRSLGGEQLRELLVLVGEVLAALLLGEIEVPVGDAAKQNRYAEEGPHGRMMRWKPDGARVIADLSQAKRFRVADQHAEDAAPAWGVSDGLMRRFVDSRRQEPLELLPSPVDHPERRVTRAGEF